MFRVRIRQVVIPALILFVLDLLAAAIFSRFAQSFWLFKNTTNWLQIAADLTFPEGVLCLLIAGLSGIGIGEHRTLVSRRSGGENVDMKEYAVGREKSISFAFQLVGIGIILILLTVVLYFASS